MRLFEEKLYFCGKRLPPVQQKYERKMKILILNGPNLNRLGRREPEIYGTSSMQDCLDNLQRQWADVEFAYEQSNCEGTLIDLLQSADDDGFDGVVFNAGAYTHTSVALHDCIRSLSVPVVEVHISNPQAREEFRRHSFITPVCKGVVAGFGLKSYELAVRALLGE